ncbi:MAG TPA: PA0069 family radical SAM protein [Cytophagales bacterium]|nr:PA0069 family radical SAM protein [Cytophagales bacterium]
MEYYKGRGAQVNTENRFIKNQISLEHIEGLDEEYSFDNKTHFYQDSPKKIVNKVESPDLRMMYSMNPYQGCEHGCIYCYARNSHQYWGFSAGYDFESKIIIKKNAPKLLEDNFLSKSWKPAVIALSGNTDCYQPIERKLKITREILKVFLKYGNPVSIITKNSLVTRDIDILQQLSKEGLVQVFVSITSLDEALRQKLEPRTATAKNRLQTLQTLSDNGIPVGVMAAPLIPSLNHFEIPEILKAASNHGALEAGYTVVRLNGEIKHIFQDWLVKNFPDRSNKVWNQISELHGGNVNDSDWGRRMKGEGNLSEIIGQLFRISYARYFSEKGLPPIRLDRFRKGGNLNLF